MHHLNPVNGKVTRVSSCEDRACSVRRRGDQAVRLRQRRPAGRELAPPFTSLPAFCSPDRHDTEAIEERLYRRRFRRAQAPNDLLDVHGGSA